MQITIFLIDFLITTIFVLQQAQDEEIFKYAKRIVIAEHQAIALREYLPALVGKSNIPEYNGYNSSIDATVSNVFATAAFRYEIHHQGLHDGSRKSHCFPVVLAAFKISLKCEAIIRRSMGMFPRQRPVYGVHFLILALVMAPLS